MAKTCQQCGTENSDTAKFCKQCAVPLRGDSASRCPKGHIIAPGQTKCPICEAEKEKQKTLVEDDRGPFAPPPVFPPIVPPVGPVRQNAHPIPPGGQGRGGASRGSTVILTQPAPGVHVAQPVSERKIVGALITYSTRPDGQIFAVREGRNRIGSNPENEVAVPDDAAMSGLNSFVVFHPQGRKLFMIDDANSQNGTFMNGEIVEERTRLQNYAEIRAGSTVFTFIAAKPETAAGAGSSSSPADPLKEKSDATEVSEL
jgi:hypothetical protein